MVCSNVPRFGKRPKLDLTRPMLFSALDRLDSGDTIGAGVLLREAVLRFLQAMADWYGVQVPKKKKHRTPPEYVKALRKAGHLPKDGAGWLTEMIDAGNACAHCRPVTARTVRIAIELLFGLMDGEPFIEHSRQPAFTTFHGGGLFGKPKDDDDDCDPSNWWKGGPK